MQQEPTFYLYDTPDGQTVPVKADPQLQLTIRVDGGEVVQHEVNLTDDEFSSLQEIAHTHRLIYDEQSGMVDIVPKQD